MFFNTLCPKSPNVWGFVAYLPFHLLVNAYITQCILPGLVIAEMRQLKQVVETGQNALCYTTVTLPKPTVARRSVSQKWENRATSADCRPTSAPILEDFLVGRRLFCRSTQVKSFVDRSADFQRFCHRWSVGRWSPDDRPTIGRRFEDFLSWYRAKVARSSGVNRPTIARRSVDDNSSKNRRQTDTGYRPSYGR